MLIAVCLFGRLRALVLALDDDARGPVGDPHGRVGLVDVLAARAAGAVGVDLEVLVVDLDVRRCRRRRARPRPRRTRSGAGARRRRATGARAGGRPSRPSRGRRRSRRCTRKVADLMPGLLPRARLQELDVEPALLGPAHLHAQHHLGPVLGVGAAGAGVDGDERVAGVVGPGEQPLLLQRLEPALDGGHLLSQLRAHVLVLGGQLDEALEVLDVRPGGRGTSRACASPARARRSPGRHAPGRPRSPASPISRSSASMRRPSASGSKVVREQLELVANRREALGGYVGRGSGRHQAPWHFLNFLPEPQGHGSLRPTSSYSPATRCSTTGASASSCSSTSPSA